MTEPPPSTLLGILRRLGPGLIVAGSIVGSGELIATTATGAEAGFTLLWLIIIGCVIKVFVQVELGRYALISGETTIASMNEVPGPALSGSGNWLVWYWFLTFVFSLAQLGGIVGGVGQALAISMPVTEQGRHYNEFVDVKTKLIVAEAKRNLAKADEDKRALEVEVADLHVLLTTLEGGVIQRLGRQQARATPDESTILELGRKRYEELDGRPEPPMDDEIWATIITLVTAVALVLGRYGLIQTFSTAMVAMFTVVTVANLTMLQSKPFWAVRWSELLHGLSFRLQSTSGGGSLGSGAGLATALAAFGIIGVGAHELVSYPYWCLEKGYARFTGPRDKSVQWGKRARGWIRVMQWDVWCSMVVYTFATLTFYLLGAAILGRTGQTPEGNDMIRTLAVMYEPVFGHTAQTLFLFGAFAVLYSTFFVANASHARVVSDAVRVLGLGEHSDAAHRRRVRILSGFFPFVCLIVYILFPKPKELVLLSGLMQAMMLPMLAGTALYFRYSRCDDRLRPGAIWDLFLWGSATGMLIAGVWAFWTNIAPLF